MLQLRGFVPTQDKVRARWGAGVRAWGAGAEPGPASWQHFPAPTDLPRAPSQVKTLEFHPVQPWIAFADKGDVVKVWDWSTQQVCARARRRSGAGDGWASAAPGAAPPPLRRIPACAESAHAPSPPLPPPPPPQVLHDLSMGGPDDEGAVEAAINRTGERDGSFATNTSAVSYLPSRAASGKVRQVRFLDSEVAHWQTASAQLMVNGTLGAPLPRASDAAALHGTRLLVVVADNKVVLFDLLSKKPFEVGKATLDGKSPTCVAFLFRGGPHAPGGPTGVDGMMASPILAVGCSDGAVRLVHLATLRLVGRLMPSAAHKSAAITCVSALPSKQGHAGGEPAAAAAAAAAGRTGGGAAAGGSRAAAAAAAAGSTFVASHDLVVAGDTSGALLLWDPFDRPSTTARDVTPFRTVDAHGGEVWALCLAPGPEDASATAPRLFSCAADKQLAAWEPETLQEMWRTKFEAKAPAMSLAYSHRWVGTGRGAGARDQGNRGTGRPRRPAPLTAAVPARCCRRLAQPALRSAPPPRRAPRYFNLSGAHALLMTVNGSAVMAMYTLSQLPLNRALRPCVDLAPLIPPGAAARGAGRGGPGARLCNRTPQCSAPRTRRGTQPCATPPLTSRSQGTKKTPKVYAVAVSPTRPNLAAVGANTGLAFLTFDRMFPLPVAAMPSHDLAAAHISPGRAPPAGAPHVSYVTHMGDALWHISCAAVPKVGGAPGDGEPRGRLSPAPRPARPPPAAAHQRHTLPLPRCRALPAGPWRRLPPRAALCQRQGARRRRGGADGARHHGHLPQRQLRQLLLARQPPVRGLLPRADGVVAAGGRGAGGGPRVALTQVRWLVGVWGWGGAGPAALRGPRRGMSSGRAPACRSRPSTQHAPLPRRLPPPGKCLLSWRSPRPRCCSCPRLRAS
jgi:hypothetical protein